MNTDRTALETGTFSVDANKKPLATVDLVPSSGASRLGVWNILSDTLQVGLGAPGAARPSTLSGASIYTTR